MSGPICDTCGKVHLTAWNTPACTGHITSDREEDGSPSKRAGEPCSNAPRKGGYVCRYHGGSTAHIARAAQQRLVMMSAQGEIAQLMRDCDIPDQNPVDGLMEVVRVAGSMMRLLAIKVGELDEDPTITEEVDLETLTVKRTGGLNGFWGFDKDNQMAIHPYVQLLRIWSERYEKACKTALDAGVAERQVKLAENQAELLATAVKAILAGLNLTPEQWELAPRVVATQLRQLSA